VALTGEILRMEAGIATVETSLRDVMESTVTTIVESRLGALAKMIRSDNRALGLKLQTSIDQDASKRSLRAMKEMQARLPAEISEAVNQRFERLSDQLHREAQSMAESMAKTTDVLGARVDRAAAAMGDRVESDLRGINEQLGETMEVLETLRSARTDRIELE
jgi:DNA anti-recombination protein RmuC